MAGVAPIAWDAFTPGAVTISTFNANSSTAANCTNTLNSLPKNCLLVLTIATANDNNDNPKLQVSDTVGLSWRQQVAARATHGGNADIWSAFFPAGGNITVTINNTGNGPNTMCTVLYCITNQETVPGGVKGNNTLQGNESVTVNTTRNNSILICVSSDWSAIDGAARVYRDSATETNYIFVSTVYTGYHYYKITTTSGSYTEGLTAPTSSPAAANTSVWEVRSLQ